ncbi:MAG: choice-of-anchor J domain-containing protein [Bacteroidia bacterium]|nr:choice-of-anchor J domain-containing protein [Bacteroidia bacterium]
MKKNVLFFSIIFSAMFAISQQVVPCVTDELYLETLKTNPLVKLEENRANTLAAAHQQVTLKKAGSVRYFPVVFHVIHKYGLENISQTQLNDAIRILNEDFRKVAGTNGGTSSSSLSIDMQYEFRLAQFDPNGQPTNGVNRIYDAGTDNATNAQKALSYWDAKRYFNVWIVNTIYNNTGQSGSIVLGYAQFPFQINSNTNTDGVIIRADQAGAIELGQLSQSGRTLTHEAGHWVGLYHPFQGGCAGATASDCANGGDQVCDTPPVGSSTSGCPTLRNSCTNDVPDLPDQVKNYMDYADGTCMNIFTPGQKIRVDNYMNIYRENAFSTTNLSAIGINTDGTYKSLTAAIIKAPYSFGFDVNSLPGTGWTIENYMSPGDSGWAINNTVALHGSGCISAQNNKNNRLNIRNAFISPSIDITTLSLPTLSFNMAYAKRLSVSGDRLKIFISDSYGRSEILARIILVSEMETGSESKNPFTPATTEWKKYSMDLTPYKSYTNCRIRFELQSLKGNNIYFDDFVIAAPTSVGEIIKQSMQFVFFPNPAHQKATVTFLNEEAQLLDMSVSDISGRVIKQLQIRMFSSGKQELEIPLEEIPAGLYLFQVKTGKGNFIHKFLIN